MEGPVLELFIENCTLCKGLLLEKFVQDGLPWEQPNKRKEQQKYDVMNLPQFPSSFSCATGEEELEKPGIKMSLEKGESFGEGVFKFCFIFSFLIILL